MRGEKRVYQMKIRKALPAHKEFLIEELRREWERIEREAKADERIRKTKAAGVVVGKAVLILLALAGVAVVATVAPNIVSVFGPKRRYRAFFSDREFRKAAKTLQKRRLVSISKEEGKWTLESTELGMARAFSISYADLRVAPLEKWDGVWRLVIFDIPNKHKWARDCLRDKLKDMRFHPLQKSVFLTPYPCESETRFLMSIFNLSDDSVRVIETRSVGDDKRFREIFGI